MEGIFVPRLVPRLHGILSVEYLNNMNLVMIIDEIRKVNLQN